MKTLSCFLIIFLSFSSLVSADHITDHDIVEPESNIRNDVYYSDEKALKKIFPKLTHFLQEKIILDSEAQQRVAKRVGHPLVEDSFNVWIVKKEDKLLGYAIKGEEVGKFRPITSMVGVKPNGKVQNVVVMVYRESHGDDVKRQRFLYQYKNKGIKDPIRINKDIMTISGATVSVRSMNRQLRKVIAVVNEAFVNANETKQS